MRGHILRLAANTCRAERAGTTVGEGAGNRIGKEQTVVFKKFLMRRGFVSGIAAGLVMILSLKGHAEEGIFVDEEPDEEHVQTTSRVVDHEGYTKEDLYDKYLAYGKMKRAGFTVAGVGSAFTVLGIVLVSSADWSTQSTPTGSQTTTSDPAGGFGLFGLILGIPGTIAGLILGGIGNSKENEYERRYHEFALRYEPETNKLGLTCRLSF